MRIIKEEKRTVNCYIVSSYMDEEGKKIEVKELKEKGYRILKASTTEYDADDSKVIIEKKIIRLKK